jgi:hypothetical protein
MKAFFTRAEDDRLGLRFEPVTFEEQLLLETFTRCVPSDPHVFQFSSWEHNHPRTMRDGLTSCWGQLTRTPKETSPHVEVEVAGQSGGRNSSAPVERETGGALFEDQRRALVQFQEACRVIGAHDDGMRWLLLACAIEAELAALDLGETSSNEATTASRAYYRAELEKYLARPDAGRGAVEIEGALRALLAAGAPKSGDGQEETLTWIAVFDNTVDSSVTWHAARGMSSVVAPQVTLALCGGEIPRHRISRTSRVAPSPADQDRFCGSCTLGEAACDTAAQSIANTYSGCSVKIDLKALVDACSTAVMERPRDGSPPMVALSADVVRAVATFALTLSREFGEAKSPGEALRWQEFAASGPHVGGDAASDAWGTVVHSIHVSAVRLNAPVTRSAAGSAGSAESKARPPYDDARDAGSIVHSPQIMQVLREVLDKWQALAEGMCSTKFQPPSVQKLQRDLERIALLRQLLNAEERAS